MRDLLIVLGAEVPSGRATAKKLRGEQYCCELMHSAATVQEILDASPAGVIVAGDLSEGAALPDPALLALPVPLLALGESAHYLLSCTGERLEGDGLERAVATVAYRPTPLFEGVHEGERWINRAAPFRMPEPYKVLAEGDGCPLAFGDEAARHYLLQFGIERNDPDGMAMLLAFAASVCRLTPWWTAENMLQSAEAAIRAGVGDREGICAMSGGLDSTVAAALAQRVLGDRLRCIFVDTGLLRAGEADEVEHCFGEEMSLPFIRVDATPQVLGALEGLTDGGQKWRVVERAILEALQAEADKRPGEKAFIKGTNYLDVIGAGKADPFPGMQVVEPLHTLFKSEIRRIGEALNLPMAVLNRQPFPGMGLAARIRGAVTRQTLQTLRLADTLFEEALQEAGLEKRLARSFAMLDHSDGQDVIVLRATQGVEPSMSAARLPYDLMERVVERITNAMPWVARVLYDMTPGKAEWS
ncbi:MAG: hypothetical protein LBM74_03325 [Oscillospiraceae bacterium]|jgi:GMP synthase (glutamine-hydrolysing)|nr:hypothetical protein [Oscillospiraceae bacterium]